MTAAPGPQQPDEVALRALAERWLTLADRPMTAVAWEDALTSGAARDVRKRLAAQLLALLGPAAPSAQPDEERLDSHGRPVCNTLGNGGLLVCVEPKLHDIGPGAYDHRFTELRTPPPSLSQQRRRAEQDGEGRRRDRESMRELIEKTHDGSKYRSRWVGPDGWVDYGPGVQTVAEADAETAAPRPGMRRAGVQFWMTGVGWVTNKVRGDHL